MEKILVLGAGPQARVVPDVVADLPALQLIGFVDEGDERTFLREAAASFAVYEAERFPEALQALLGQFSVLVASRFPDHRASFIARAAAAGLAFATVVHPSAVIARTACLGRDVLVMPGVVLGAGVRIGDHCIVNGAASIDHDGVLTEGVIIGPGVHFAGGVTVGSGAFIGVGACAAPGVSIGADSLIGAGSVVIRDIPAGVIAAGNPAKVIRPRDEKP